MRTEDTGSLRTAGRARVVTGLSVCIAAAMMVLAVLHARAYFFLFDDFALIGQASQWPVERLVTEPLFGFFRPLPFLAARAEHAFFGWVHPAGYALTQFGFHAANACMVAMLCRRLAGSNVGAAIGGVVFALSPWAGEAIFWFSASFDVLATSGMLAACLLALHAARVPQVSWAAAFGAAAVLSAALALLSKESAIVLPGVMACLVVAVRSAGQPVVARRAAWTIAAVILVAGMYLTVRSAVVGTVDGGTYGGWIALIREAPLFANAGTLLSTFASLPSAHDRSMRPSGLVPFLAPFYVASLLATVAGAIGRWRVCWPLALAFGLSLLPVLWVGMNAGSSAGSRVLYVPGVFVAVIAGVAASRACEMRPAWSAVVIAALVVFSARSLASINTQRVTWAQAALLSKSTVQAFAPWVGTRTPIHIENLPFWFEEGPYVIKSYAFGYYYHPAVVPPTSATALTLVLLDGRPSVTLRGPEPGAAPLDPSTPWQSVVLPLALR